MPPIRASGHAFRRSARPAGPIEPAQQWRDTDRMSMPPASGPIQLREAEDPACGLHRIAMSEMACAFTQLERARRNPASGTHECRKCIKRLRALARLAKPRRPTQWKRADRHLRRAAHALAGRRDADVAETTARALAPESTTNETTDALRAAAGDQKPAGKQACRSLKKAHRALDNLLDASGTWRRRDLRRGLREQYRRFRRRALVYLQSGTADDAHAVRKDLQRHLAQLHIVAAVTPGGFLARIESLTVLSGVLGEHHDLTLVRGYLKSARQSIGKSARKKIRAAARARQRTLESEIAARLPSLIDLTPRRFAATIGTPKRTS